MLDVRSSLTASTDAPSGESARVSPGVSSNPAQPGRQPALRLLTVGHGTAAREELATLLTEANVELLVDVRSAPGSRRHPQFNRAELETWTAEAGVAYRWEPDLGGHRRANPNSRHTAIRNASFRGYADYMESELFTRALARVLDEAARRTVAVMCAETLWWRCHRRMIADAATLLHDAEVLHLGHDGRLFPHRLTDGARLDGSGGIVYRADEDAPRLGETW